MDLYNTLTRKKEPFEPVDDPITMYVCGVTPYDDAHLGHAMSIIIFDVLRRYLEWRGRSVRFVYNFTDIDDKMIARAARLGIPVRELAERQIGQFQQEWRELNIRPADVHPRATEEIPQMIEIIGRLEQNEMAYAANGDVYFRVQRKENYGKLSRRVLDDMIAGARIEPNERKAHPMDFALWKAAKEGEPSWDSPWGAGRPGWHIECSAMALRYLGEQIDLHGGGMDLVFPHHENEIAQSESYTGKAPFVRHWIHNAMMQLGDEKMSKSLGNIITLREGLDSYGADALRLFVFSGHYRSPLTYSREALAAAARGAERLRTAVRAEIPEGDGEIDRDGYRERFIATMDDDLGTPQALAVLFDLAREINRARDAGQPAGRALEVMRELGGILGLEFQAVDRKADLAPFIDLLIEVRTDLRARKEFALADQIRERLSDLGVSLEDGREGTTWRSAGPGKQATADSAAETPSNAESTLRF
ncbi:MAG: cysteine--tRNA ligase [Dehalococcoidia bacterium]